MLAQAAEKLSYLAGIAVRRAFFAVLVLTVLVFTSYGRFHRQYSAVIKKSCSITGFLCILVYIIIINIKPV